MEGVFLEFENENGQRSYPFAEGCVPPSDISDAIPDGVFVDAAIYPVNPVGTVYLSEVSADGVFSVSDDTGVIMSGSPVGDTVEFHDMSPFSRHVGTMVASSKEALDEFAGRGVARSYRAGNTAFSASCIFPVTIDGVTSISIGDAGAATGEIRFSNASDDHIRVSSGLRDDGRRTLRFDVLPRPEAPDESYIKRVICVVDGQTPFRIGKNADLSYNTVMLSLEGIDREVICAAAHRENSYEMADTCGSDRPSTQPGEYLPETYQLEEVLMPPSQERENGADNAFYLVAPNLLNYVNPLSITLEDGVVVPRTSEPRVVMNGTSAELAEGEMLDTISSKGVVLQVPGLSGGQI